ncbi:Uncharacterised protein [Candidatus Tiddalikarchaeum anstoanum]|nr:Uncharacterised protein [Candidatus Tiddalikarchaeum anstoanum]
MSIEDFMQKTYSYFIPIREAKSITLPIIKGSEVYYLLNKKKITITNFGGDFFISVGISEFPAYHRIPNDKDSEENIKKYIDINCK